MDIGKLEAQLLFRDLVNPDFLHRSDVALMDRFGISPGGK